MKTIAFTIVMNDMVILELWLSYYSKHFDECHVLLNGTKEVYNDYIAKMAERLRFTYERTNGFAGDSPTTLRVIKDKQKELLENHSWVLYCDCDEFIVPTKKYKDLRDFMEKNKEMKKTRCITYDVFQAEDEGPIDFSKPYLKQRKYWFKDDCYNKPLLAQVPLNWVEGFHREAEEGEQKNAKNMGLFMLHLKFSDLTAQRDFGPTRTNVDMGWVEKGMLERKRIPPYIRRAF